MTGEKIVLDFLAHYGVQGMKWGVRRAANKASVESLKGKGLTAREAKNTNRYQNRVDMQRMTAKGREGKVGRGKQALNRFASNQMLSPTTVLRHPLSSKKAAIRQLEKNQNTKDQIAKGEKRVTAALLKFQGVSIANIDFSTD